MAVPLALLLLIGSVTEMILNGFSFLMLLPAAAAILLALWGLRLLPGFFRAGKPAGGKAGKSLCAVLVFVIMISAYVILPGAMAGTPEADIRRQVDRYEDTLARQEADKAFRIIETLVADYPDVMDLHNRMGLFYYYKGDEKEALKLFQAVSATRPTDARAYYLAAGCHFGAGNLKEALKACRTALMIDPHYAAAYEAMGDIYDRQGDMNRALYYYRLAKVENTLSVLPRIKLGLLYSRGGNYTEAANEFQAAVLLAQDATEETMAADLLADVMKVLGEGGTTQ